MPTTTPRSTPTDSTPMTAAIAIQKSNGFTRRSRRNSARSIIPKTTASMMIAARTAFGSSEKSGARRIKVARTIAPVASEATGVLAPAASFSELADRLVDTGMPWKKPAPTFAIPWATDSWLRSTRYRCLVANAWASPAVWENPISRSAKAEIAIVGRFCDTTSIDGTCGSGRPRGTGPTSATPCAPRSRRTDPISPPTTRTSAPGILGIANRSPRMTARATTPTSNVAQAEVAEAPNPRRELLPGIHTVGGGSCELGQLADDDVDRGAGKEPGHDREREEAREPAELEDGDEQEQHPGQDRDRRDQLRRIGCHRGRSGGPRRRQRPRATSSGRSRCAATCRRGRR